MAVAAIVASGVRSILAYAARRLATALWTWAKAKVVDYVFTKAEAWVGEGVNWLVEKITGKPQAHWDLNGKITAEASIAALATTARSGELADILRTTFLQSPEGEAFLEKWLPILEEESGTRARAMKWEIDEAPIPASLPIKTWAVDIATRFGMSVKDVISRRLAHT